MEEREIMAFKDESGNKIECEVVARLQVDQKNYMILSPVEGGDEDAFAFRVDEEDGNVVYNFVEDEEEFERVQKKYKEYLEEE
ncbi:DUF1292 domain-containing protein [Clostridium thermarum]|uniref:DUF1292 domain-containing protein n=1 Tax=Clostridium thermarum TaxID=1716543 RepID=UPI00111CA2ED|nr:DUF1292 domain-containing protein [Clostridium thermarum]